MVFTNKNDGTFFFNGELLVTGGFLMIFFSCLPLLEEHDIKGALRKLELKRFLKLLFHGTFIKSNRGAASLGFWSAQELFRPYIPQWLGLYLCMFTLSSFLPTIMEVENHPKWKETNIGGTLMFHFHDDGRKGKWFSSVPTRRWHVVVYLFVFVICSNGHVAFF